MKITREKLLQVWGVLSQLSQEKTTAKGAYGIAKNKKLLEAEIKSMEEARENLKYPKEKLEEFDTKRIALCKELADKEEDGSPKLDKNMFVFSPDNKAIFEEKFSVIREEYKDVLEERNKVDTEYRTFLSEETELTVHEIKIADMPDGVSAAQIEVLGDIIVD